MDLHKPLLASIVGWIIFIVASAWVNFPYLVDEYWYLYAWVTQPNFGLDTFKAFMSLRPVFGLMNTVTFVSGLINYPKMLIWAYFLVHSITLTYLIRWIIHECPPQQTAPSVRNSKQTSVIFILSTVPAILYPSNHEMLFMVLNLPYTLGLCFLTLTVYQKRSWLQIPLLTLAFASLETYVLPGLALLCLPVTWRFLKNRNWQTYWRGVGIQIAIFLTAYALFQGLEQCLGHWYGIGSRDWSSLLRWDLARSHAKLLFDFLWHIHFYKTNWILTAIQMVLVVGVSVYLIRKKTISAPQTVLLLLLPWFSGLHYLIVPYYAPRAIYGASEIRNIVIAYLLFHFLRDFRSSWAKLVPVLLFVAYCAQLIVVFKIKDTNQTALVRSMTEIQSKIAACVSPCAIEIENPQNGIKRDWMMLPEYHQYYALWVAKRHFPEKSVTFQIKPELNRSSGR